MANDEDRVVITLPVVYAKLEELSGTFSTFVATYNERELHRERHEERIQRLERWKAAMPVSLLTSLAAALLALSR